MTSISIFNKAKTIAKSLDSSTGQIIVPIFSNTLTGNYPGQIVSVNAFVKNLKAHAKISSLAPVKLPNFTLEDSETDKLYKTLDIEWGSARKQLNLYISDNQVDWYQVGAISLLNPSGYPYRIYNLMDLIAPLLDLAAMWKVANYRKTGAGDPKENLKKFLKNAGKLSEDIDAGMFLEKMKKYSAQEEKDKNPKDLEDDWDKFTEEAEMGFISQPGILDKTNPYGRPLEERPKIRDITADTSE